MGDLTITWSSDKDDDIREIVEEQLKKGVRFFIIKPFTKEQLQIKNISDITSRELIVSDDDVLVMFGKKATIPKLGKAIKENKVSFGKRVSNAVISTLKPTKNVDEIVSSHSVGTAPLKGG
jgi:hypothetical protein